MVAVKMAQHGEVSDRGQPWTLSTLQPALSSTTRARPPRLDSPSQDIHTARSALQQPQIQKRESRGGLRGIFIRTKSERQDKPVAPSMMEEHTTAASLPERPTLIAATSSSQSGMSLKRPKIHIRDASMIPSRPPQPDSRASRISLRSRSLKRPKSTGPGSRSPKSLASSTSKMLARAAAAWDPPPLFQAYPQAIKHAQLSATAISADSVLRMSAQRRHSSIRDESSRIASDMGSEGGITRSIDKTRLTHRRQITGSMSKTEWTQKVYVLVTSGYLIQYAGCGPFDRLPEKILQLGKDSVVFASDVLPGKHWVLQVSQVMDGDGTPSAAKPSLISRLTFKGVDYRRTTTSLLLVLESAEEMDSWLSVIRKEIEAMGGKRHVSETGEPMTDEQMNKASFHPSHRYFPLRYPGKVPDPALRQAPSSKQINWTQKVDLELPQGLIDDGAHRSHESSPRRLSTSSITNSNISHEEQQLENLRDNQNRLSCMSSGQRTLITSQNSSPVVSPTRDTFDENPSKRSIEDTRPRPNAAAISDRRRSMQNTYVRIIETSGDTSPTHRQSAHSELHSRSQIVHSLAPNFSVPTSSSKRYSAIKGTGIKKTPQVITSASSLDRNAARPKDMQMIMSPNLPPNDSLANVDDPAAAVERKPSEVACVPDLMADDVPPSLHDRTTLTPSADVRFSQEQNAASKEGALEQFDSHFPRKCASMVLLRDVNIPDHPHSYLGTANLTPTNQRTLHLENGNRVSIVLEEDATLVPDTDLIPQAHDSARISSNSLAASRLSVPTAVSNFPAISTRRSFTSHTKTVSASSTRFQDLHHLQELDLKALGNRRSMPLLMNGPPSAPPPNCALPPLPSLKAT